MEQSMQQTVSIITLKSVHRLFQNTKILGNSTHFEVMKSAEICGGANTIV